MLTRRLFLAGAAASAALPSALCAAGRTSHASSIRLRGLPAAFRRLEEQNACRIGVAVLDTATGERSGYRPGERFTMCSTFKCLLVAAVLRQVHEGRQTLDALLPVPKAPLLPVSPLTEPHAGGSMTVESLCAASLIRSDNTAANILLGAIGGPTAWTAYVRSLNDRVSRLDHNEPALNESHPGDPSDTTTPLATVGNLQRVLVDPSAAPVYSRLKDWMIACQTGSEKLRRDLPAGWTAADRTGGNGETISNDIAVLWPPSGRPLVVAAYIAACPGPEPKRAAILASIGRITATALA